jgi:uncharacterized membrane protein
MRVLLAGESWFTYSVHQKGFDSFTTCVYEEGRQWLEKALQEGGHHVDYLPNHLAPAQFPTRLEELAGYGAVILSDIGSNTLLLHPRTLKLSERTPNRLGLIQEYVAGGGGLVMCGGWMSFQGIEGKANYRGTAIEEILPVDLLDKDDRVEVPEGFVPEFVEEDHPILAGVPTRWPAFLFYNRLRLKRGSTLLARRGADALIAMRPFGRGRTMAFAMDIAPHGSPREFLEWEHFPTFWNQAVQWVSQGDRW